MTELEGIIRFAGLVTCPWMEGYGFWEQVAETKN